MKNRIIIAIIIFLSFYTGYFASGNSPDWYLEHKIALMSLTLPLIFSSVVLAGITKKLHLRNSHMKKQSMELQEKLSHLMHYNQILDETAVVSRTSKSGIITEVNSSFEKITGYNRDEIIGQSHSILRHPEMPESTYKELWRTILKGDIWRGVIVNRCKDGRDLYLDTAIFPVFDNNRKIKEFIAVRANTTTLFDQRAIIQKLSLDEMTNLGNKSKLFHDIPGFSNPFLVLIDIDNFQKINVIHGIENGDKLIKIFAENLKHYILRENLEEKIKLYRDSNDEFALLGEFTDIHSLNTMVQSLSNFVKEQSIIVNEITMDISVTVGYAMGVKDLYIRTKMALKNAMSESENFRYYNDGDESMQKYTKNLRMLHEIQGAIKRESFVPYFQPIVHTTDMRLAKFEVLARMHDASGTRYMPKDFFSVAEHTKYYQQITLLILKKTYEQFTINPREYCINISTHEIVDREFITILIQYLNRDNFGKHLTLEILEIEGIENYDKVSDFIYLIKKYGCKIVIDDFGTGYSNFYYLSKLPIDGIKIDGSIIKASYSDRKTRDLLESIVSFAKKITVTTTAEFIENKELYLMVKEIGMDYSQGYFFGEPSPTPEFCHHL